MRVLALAFGLILVALAGPARAQFCPGVTPWVFDDVQESDPFCGFVTFMATSGVTTGCSTIDANHRLYCPEGFVTRKQMAAFMSRLASSAVFAEGGNSFGGPAVLGTNDDHRVELHVNGVRGLAVTPATAAPNVIAGHPNNETTGTAGSSVLGGGSSSMCGLSSGPLIPCSNVVSGNWSTIAGGYANRVTSASSFVGGGVLNAASGPDATVGGGVGNSAEGSASTVPGGRYNVASGNYSFAAGFRAKATTNGSFIWADSRNFDFFPSVGNFFGVRATGGVGFTVAIDGTTGAVAQFCNYLPGYSGWSCTSDRDAKENFEPVRATDVLDRLVAMPVYTYNFKGADPSLRMLGATAQDFHDAFGLGEERTTIASGNLHGVALAAIQGLNAKVDDREAALWRELHAKEAEIVSLHARLTELAQAVERLQRLVVAPAGATP